MSDHRADHWDGVYSRLGEATVSWFQDVPTFSLAILEDLEVDPCQSEADVGAGTSHLVNELVGRGFIDITVVEVSGAALEHARARVGTAGEHLQWMVHNVLTWDPSRTFDVWHDRAVFHFLTESEDVQRYLNVRSSRCASREAEPADVA